MAKAQKRTNKEVRKPKATKAKASAALAPSEGTQVNALMKKPKARL